MLRNRKVVFIMTDSQRHDMCSCYRETGLQTPCIDRLASRGMRFANAYTTQPVCQPARAASPLLRRMEQFYGDFRQCSYHWRTFIR